MKAWAFLWALLDFQRVARVNSVANLPGFFFVGCDAGLLGACDLDCFGGSRMGASH